jgi:hypothetical protein
MGEAFEEFISAVLIAASIEEERELIAEEQAKMRNAIKSGAPEERPRTVAKLVYLAMSGENVSWGQMEVVRLMTADRFSSKRIGYVAATALLNEMTELTVLITATVQKDLQSTDRNSQKLALDLIANIGTAEMSQSLPQDVLKLIDSLEPTIQKRAAMAAVTILRRNPEIYETFRPAVARLLNSTSHCCLHAGVQLALQMLAIEPSLREPWSQFSAACTGCLKNLFENKQENEYTFMIFSDPFLQIAFLRLIGTLNSPSDELDDVLSSIATGSDVRRNAGRSILLQTVSTIANVAKKPSLRSLACNQVGRLFGQGSQPNIVYSALSAFSRILYAQSSVLDRSSSDSQVLQRYKSEVVRCLDHRDPSIRRRALDVVAALVDETNVQTLIPEVISYVRLADTTFRTELVAKIFSSVQRFAPSVRWNFDTVFRLLSDSGNYVGTDVIVAFAKSIATSQSIRLHAIKTLAEALKVGTENQPLLQVAAWALGEFQEDPSDSIDVMIRLTTMPQTVAETKLMLITALAKLAVRFGEAGKVKDHFQVFVNSNNLEIQQRTGEMLRVLDRPDVYEQLLAPIEVDDAEEPARTIDRASPAGEPLLIEMGGEPAKAESKRKPKGEETPAKVDAPKPTFTPPANSVEALKTADIVVYFQIQRNPANPAELGIRSTIVNLGKVTLSKFAVQYAAVQGWQIIPQTPSGNVLEPMGRNTIRQLLYAQNRGVLPLKMMAQLTFMYGTQPIKEQHPVNPIFG